MPPAVKATLVACVAVWLAWKFPPLERFLVENFVVSWTHVASGRVWTLVTAAFSHIELWHLLFNLVVLASFGPVVERLLGTATFVRFYLAAAAVSSLTHSLTSAFLLGRPGLAALGASGALSAVLMLFALTFPRHKILIFGIIPVPALLGALAFVGLDLWGLVAQSRGGGLPIGHGAHLGGAAFGAAMYWMWRDRLAVRLGRPRPAEREPSPPAFR